MCSASCDTVDMATKENTVSEIVYGYCEHGVDFDTACDGCREEQLAALKDAAIGGFTIERTEDTVTKEVGWIVLDPQSFTVGYHTTRMAAQSAMIRLNAERATMDAKAAGTLASATLNYNPEYQGESGHRRTYEGTITPPDSNGNMTFTDEHDGNTWTVSWSEIVGEVVVVKLAAV